MTEDKKEKKRSISLDKEAQKIYDSWKSHGEKARNASAAIKLFDKLLTQSDDNLKELCVKELSNVGIDAALKASFIDDLLKEGNSSAIRLIIALIRTHEEKYHNLCK